MKTNIFALYSPYLQCYDLPMVSGMSASDYVESYRRLIKQDQERAFSLHINEKKLCHIGSYDDITGMLKPKTPIVLCDLASFFDKDFISKKLAQTVEAAKKLSSDGNPADDPEDFSYDRG